MSDSKIEDQKKQMEKQMEIMEAKSAELADKIKQMDYKDDYQALGVEKGATPAEMRKQYHKIALKIHPDKQKTEQNEIFDIISESQKMRENSDKLSEQEKNRLQQAENKLRADMAEIDKAYDEAFKKTVAAKEKLLGTVSTGFEEPLPLSSEPPAPRKDVSSTSAEVYSSNNATFEGDTQLVLQDYLRGMPKDILGGMPRELTDDGALLFDSMEQQDKFMDYQVQMKREFVFSIDTDGSSKAYNKYDPHRMGFKDGSSYKDNLDVIYKTMKDEQTTLQKELVDLQKQDNPSQEKIAEKEAAIKLQEYKLDKVKGFMGANYNPEFNKPIPGKAESLTVEEGQPLLKEAAPVSMLTAPSSTKTPMAQIQHVDIPPPSKATPAIVDKTKEMEQKPPAPK